MTGKDIRITKLDKADLAEATGLSAALGWPYRPEDWAFAHGLGEGLALRHDKRLIGTALRWDYGPAFATVGMIIVDADYRGQGLGARLVDALLADAGERSVILNATPDGLELYRRRGFVAYGLTCQHQGIFSPQANQPKTFRIERATAADWPSLAEIDRQASGMPRDRLLAALAECGSISVLRDKDGAVQGYAVCREFGRGHVVGPVIASGPVEAAALIADAAADLSGRFVRVNTPEQSGLGPWLEAQGLVRVDAEVAMVRGVLPEASTRARIFGLCSNSLG